MANMIGFYGWLVLWAAAAVTQVASLAGAMADINLMVWGYGIGMAGALIELIAGLLHFYGKWSAFGINRDTTKTALIKSAAGFVYGKMSNEEV